MRSNKSSDKVSRNVLRKNTIRRLLMDRDLTALENAAGSHKNIMRTLSSLIYDHEPLIRWRAIEALGKASRIVGKTNLDKVRRQIRRILWLMNDESGGLCWNGPEAIGEVIYNNPVLIYEYGPILISFLSEEPFEAGTRRAISRVADMNPEIFSKSAPQIAESLNNPDPEIRAFSIAALNALEDRSAYNSVKTLKDDPSPVENYDFSEGKLQKTAVGEFARLYLNRYKKTKD